MLDIKTSNIIFLYIFSQIDMEANSLTKSTPRLGLINIIYIVHAFCLSIAHLEKKKIFIFFTHPLLIFEVGVLYY